MADGGEVHDDNVDDLGPGKNMLREDHIDKMPKPKKWMVLWKQLMVV